MTERDRSKKMTSDNLEEFGLAPPEDHHSGVVIKEIDKSEDVATRVSQSEAVHGIADSQSGMVNGSGAYHSNDTVHMNGHIEDDDDLPPLEGNEDAPVT